MPDSTMYQINWRKSHQTRNSALHKVIICCTRRLVYDIYCRVKLTYKLCINSDTEPLKQRKTRWKNEKSNIIFTSLFNLIFFRIYINKSVNLKQKCILRYTCINYTRFDKEQGPQLLFMEKCSVLFKVEIHSEWWMLNSEWSMLTPPPQTHTHIKTDPDTPNM